MNAASDLTLTGVAITDLALLLRAARVEAAALRNEPDSNVRAYVRVLECELTDQIEGLQSAQCDDDDDAARRDMRGHNRRGGWMPDAQDRHEGMDRAEFGA